MITLIASVDRKMAIGYKGKLLFRDKDDMKHFRETTMGATVIMGRKTFEEIGKPLNGRENVIISKQDLQIEGADVENDIDFALEIIQWFEESVFIIGGSSIFEYFLPHADRIILSHHSDEFQADKYFPSIEGWRVTNEKILNEKLKVRYYENLQRID